MSGRSSEESSWKVQLSLDSFIFRFKIRFLIHQFPWGRLCIMLMMPELRFKLQTDPMWGLFLFQLTDTKQTFKALYAYEYIYVYTVCYDDVTEIKSEIKSEACCDIFKQCGFLSKPLKLCSVKVILGLTVRVTRNLVRHNPPTLG